MAAVGIIGAGTWGTALAVLLNNNGHDVTTVSYTHLTLPTNRLV